MADNKQAVNEFNQQVKPVSLWADAWKRLKKNRMALIGLWITVIFALVGLFAPILPLIDYTHTETDFTNLPPSFRPAGEVALSEAQKRIELIGGMVKDGRADLVPELEKSEASYEKLKREYVAKPASRNIYIFGTDYLGRDMLARLMHGARVSLFIGIVAPLLFVSFGVAYGSMAGFLGGRVDQIMMRLLAMFEK